MLIFSENVEYLNENFTTSRGRMRSFLEGGEETNGAGFNCLSSQLTQISKVRPPGRP